MGKENISRWTAFQFIKHALRIACIEIALISKLCKTVNVHSDYSTLTAFNRTTKWLETFSSTAIHIHDQFRRQLLHQSEIKKRCLKFLRCPHELSLMVLIKRTKGKEWTSVIDVWRRNITQTDNILHLHLRFFCLFPRKPALYTTEGNFLSWTTEP